LEYEDSMHPPVLSHQQSSQSNQRQNIKIKHNSVDENDFNRILSTDAPFEISCWAAVLVVLLSAMMLILLFITKEIATLASIFYLTIAGWAVSETILIPFVLKLSMFINGTDFTMVASDENRLANERFVYQTKTQSVIYSILKTIGYIVGYILAVLCFMYRSHTEWIWFIQVVCYMITI
jgi:hypothetical protein